MSENKNPVTVNYFLQIKQLWRNWPSLIRIFLGVLGIAVLVFGSLNIFFPLRVELSYAPVITDREGKVIHAFLSYDDKWRMQVSLDEITPELQKAIVFKEDKYFFLHRGINPIALLRAVYANSVTGRRTSGASTITMQVARLLEPKKRTYGNKIIEMFRATQLEWKYSKKEILQLYLNLVPYGGNIEGVKSASILYFQKSPRNLSLAELTALVVIPNRPTSLRLGKNNPDIIEVRNKWLQRFEQAKLFPRNEIQDALLEDMVAYRHEAPRLAPHFARRIKSMYPNTPILNTHLNSEWQETLEGMVRRHVQPLAVHQIKNATALVIDNESHAVVAYVGSADFFNTQDAGQVDGIQAVRSPGSALKPLVYGLAIDQGLITPKTLLSDVPTHFGAYSPENYDRRFHGKVSVEFALAHSLNVPAVKVLG